MADSDIRLMDTQSGGLICLSCASQQNAAQNGTLRAKVRIWRGEAVIQSVQVVPQNQ